MTSRGVILYGPPTSGKDTITAELVSQDARYALLPKLKAGTGRTTGYRHVPSDELATLRAAGRLVVETPRYGNRYAVDRHDVEALTEAGRIPVAHMGNLADLERLRSGIPLDWTAVLLWIPRQVCAQRSTLRGDADTLKRLQAWDQTKADLDAAETPLPFDLTIHTHETDPTEAARRISGAVRSG